MNAISYYFVRRFLAKASQEHVKNYPQVACFSFDLITLFIHLDGQYERDELMLLSEKVLSNLPKDSTCLDIGANIGNHSLHFAPHFEKVISFEPHPRTFRLLQLNAELAPNVEPINIGASSQPGQVDVFQDKLNIAASSIGKAGSTAQSRVTFELAKIDDIPQVIACSHISFIKIDVEGHEAQAILGAAETIRKNRPIIMIEVLPSEIEDGTSESIKQLRALGYAHFYEPLRDGFAEKVPRKLRKAARSLSALFSGKRLSKAKRLREVGDLEKRSYLMLVCTMDPLPNLST